MVVREEQHSTVARICRDLLRPGVEPEGLQDRTDSVATLALLRGGPAVQRMPVSVHILDLM